MIKWFLAGAILLLSITMVQLSYAKDIEQDIPDYVWEHGEWPEEPVFGHAYSLEREHIITPEEMNKNIDEVFMDCEVKGWWGNYNSPADVVSETQDYGVAQVNIIHKQPMYKLDLDFSFEGHRVWYAIWVLWADSGWFPWSCRYMVGI